MLIDWERFLTLNNRYSTLSTETDKEMVDRLEKTKIRKESVTRVSKTRTLLKAISWRVVGTLDTMALGWIVTGSPLVGLKIGALELVTKFVLYYFHERIWLRSVVGIRKPKGITPNTNNGGQNWNIDTHWSNNKSSSANHYSPSGRSEENYTYVPTVKGKSQKEIQQTIEDAVQDFINDH
tara:strand:+ start:3142 stop:3681 length:540 start_codon:yes stop_codon:yes gene_type:complete